MTFQLPAADVAAVARLLLGDENKSQSKADELRWGSRGSLSVDLCKGTFYDNEQAKGGGLLELVHRQTGRKGKDAIAWLRSNGFIVPDERPQNSQQRPPSGMGIQSGSLQAHAAPRPRIVATYDYTDETGALLFQVCRMEPKDFRQRRPESEARDGWNWSVRGVRQVPFRLAELIKAVKAGETVFVVEGEKDVLALAEWGITATCNAGGAGKWPNGFEAFFQDADVVILPDNDPQSRKKRPDGSEVLVFDDNGRPKFAGQDHALLVADRLLPVARRVRVLELPDLPRKGDVSDWKAAGGTPDALFELVETRAVLGDAYRTPSAEGPNPDRPDDPPWDGGDLPPAIGQAPAPFVSKFNAVPWHLLDMPGQEHEWLVKNIMTRGEVAMMVGASRAGKSFEALNLVMSVCRGIPFWGNRSLRGGVAYQAGEGGKGIKRRVRAYRQFHGLSVSDKIPFVLLPKPIDLYASDEHTNDLISEVRHHAQAWVVPLELVVIDTLSSATPGADENSSKDIGPVLARCQRIAAELTCAVLLVHHMNAGGNKPRGHTSIMANLDSVIEVVRSETLKDADGRDIRECKTTKQKDGEDGRRWRFVLRSVEVGQDQDGEPITSCICVEPNMGAMEGVERHAEDLGIKLTDQCRHFLGAIDKALADHGVPPPPELNLPRHIRVVEFRHIKNAFVAREWDEAPLAGTAAAVSAGTIRQAMSRHGKTLTNKGIIMKEGNFVWMTGRKVRGYRPPVSTQASEPSCSPAPADDRLDDLY